MRVEEYLRDFVKPSLVLQKVRRAAKAKGLDRIPLRTINLEISRQRRERRGNSKND